MIEDMQGESGKRSKREREIDRGVIARLYAEGQTQQQIADAINANRPEEKRISKSQVNLDLQSVRTEWREMRLNDAEEVIMRQLAAYRLIQAEAWSRLRKSSQDAEKVVVEDMPPGNDGKPRKKITTSREGQAGDPRWMEIFLKALAGEARLLGLGVDRVSDDLPTPFMVVRLGDGQTQEDFHQAVARIAIVNGSNGNGNGTAHHTPEN
jgi:hypothetical protein